MATENPPSTRIEQFLKPKAVSSRKLARDPDGRLLMAEESALDLDRIRDAGITVAELGRRVRVYNSDMTKQTASYVIPSELTEMSPGAANLSGIAKTQIGRLVWLDGLYLRHNPGIHELGINDRGDVVLRLDAAAAEDATIGPVLNSYNTIQSTLSDRIVARIDKKAHDRDVKEARAWLEAMNVLSGGKTLRARFYSGGIQAEHRGNIPQLYKTTQVNFFQMNDPLNLELAKVLDDRFEVLERPLPMVRVISVVGIPPNERAYKEFVNQLKKKKTNPMSLGLPSRLRDSQFFDSSSKSVVPSCFINACKLDELGDTIFVVTINTDFHGEIKARGLHSSTAAVMSMADVICAHASSAILNSEGTSTIFIGGEASGKTRAATAWSERNSPGRRKELARRYAKEGKDAAEIMKGVGFIGQDDWLNLVPAGEGAWDMWPAERFFYLRSRGLASRDLILAENEPFVENATADYGASANAGVLGQCTHDYPHERIFYDPDWDNFYCDRDVHPVSALILLEHDEELDFAVRRVKPAEAMEFILRGRGPLGSDQPFYSDYTDLSGLLISRGVVGDRLLEAYEAAKRGDVAALMNGDEALGAIVLDRLERMVHIYEHLLADLPVFVVNTMHGDDLVQDINWYVSEHPDFLKPAREKSESELRKLMKDQFGVTYDEAGAWTRASD
ncbi:MAG: hypothetical protein ACE5E4_00880 [Candidatus Binatia bacterium]